MNNDSIKLLFLLLGSIFQEHQPVEYNEELINENNLLEVMTIAAKHDIAHLVAYSVKTNNLTDEKDLLKFQQVIIKAVQRYERLNYEFERLCEELEKEQIPYLPLKGSVIKNYYPQPWMRTSCDIDILVHEEDLKKAILSLVNNLKYTQTEMGSHDVSLFSETGIHIELHYSLVEKWKANSSSKLLADVWQTSKRKDGYSFNTIMSNEMFYFYHIAHMAKHFETGGCGIRALIDLWILENKLDIDKKIFIKMLTDANLLSFYNASKNLSDVWFNKAEHSQITLMMEEFILTGGVYGTLKNSSTVKSIKHKGKLAYFLSLLFISRKELEAYYPKLKKYSFLFPFYQIKRWFRILNKKKRKGMSNIINARNSVTEEEKQFVEKLFHDLDLK